MIRKNIMTVKKEKGGFLWRRRQADITCALGGGGSITETAFALDLPYCKGCAAWSTATTPEPINANAATIAKTTIVLFMSILGIKIAKKFLLKSIKMEDFMLKTDTCIFLVAL